MKFNNWGSTMKQLIFLILLTNPAFGATEQACYEVLTSNYTKESQAFSTMADFNEEMPKEEQAEQMVRNVLAELGCDQGILFQEVTCTEVIPNQSRTEVCYLRSELGYFFTIQDMVDTGTVIFNRWD